MTIFKTVSDLRIWCNLNMQNYLQECSFCFPQYIRKRFWKLTLSHKMPLVSFMICFMVYFTFLFRWAHDNVSKKSNFNFMGMNFCTCTCLQISIDLKKSSLLMTIRYQNPWSMSKTTIPTVQNKTSGA